MVMQAIRGMRDIFYPETAKRQHVITTLRKVVEKHSFQEVREKISIFSFLTTSIDHHTYD